MNIYAIYDSRQKEYVCDPLFLENDIQAAIAYRNFQKQLIDNKLVCNDLQLRIIGCLDKGLQQPILLKEPTESPTYIVGNEE